MERKKGIPKTEVSTREGNMGVKDFWQGTSAHDKREDED